MMIPSGGVQREMANIMDVSSTCAKLSGDSLPDRRINGVVIALLLFGSFLWISVTNTNQDVPYGNLELDLAGHESLRTLKVAAMATRMTDSQVEDIFGNNIRQRFGF